MGSVGGAIQSCIRKDIGNRPVADRLASCKDAILSDWLHRAMAEIPAAKGLGRQEMLDDMSRIIGGLVNTLNGKASLSSMIALGHDHGLSRASEPGFTIEHVSQEYGILWDMLCDSLATGVENPVSDLKVVGLALSSCSQ